MLRTLFAIAAAGTAATLTVWHMQKPRLYDPAREDTYHLTAAMQGPPAAADVPELRIELAPYFLQREPVIDKLPCAAIPLPAEDGICAWARFDQDIIVPDIVHSDGAAPWAAAHFNLMRDYNAPAAYQQWEGARMATAIAAIHNDPFIRAHYNEIKRQQDYDDNNDSRAQWTLKHGIMQRMADHIRAAFDLPPIAVRLYKYSANSLTLQGAYDPYKQSLTINYDIFHGTTSSLPAMLPVVLEETKHSIDNDFAYELLMGGMSKDDIRAPHAAAILMNAKDYIPYFRSQTQYELQYSERTAKVVAHAAAALIAKAFAP